MLSDDVRLEHYRLQLGPCDFVFAMMCVLCCRAALRYLLSEKLHRTSAPNNRCWPFITDFCLLLGRCDQFLCDYHRCGVLYILRFGHLDLLKDVRY